jgi:hypothetical protein
MARVQDDPKTMRPKSAAARAVGRDVVPPKREAEDAEDADYCPTAALLAARKRALTIWVSG